MLLWERKAKPTLRHTSNKKMKFETCPHPTTKVIFGYLITLHIWEQSLKNLKHQICKVPKEVMKGYQMINFEI